MGEDDDELGMQADDEDNDQIETERAIRPAIFKTQDYSSQSQNRQVDNNSKPNMHVLNLSNIHRQ